MQSFEGTPSALETSAWFIEMFKLARKVYQVNRNFVFLFQSIFFQECCSWKSNEKQNSWWFPPDLIWNKSCSAKLLFKSNISFEQVWLLCAIQGWQLLGFMIKMCFFYDVKISVHFIYKKCASVFGGKLKIILTWCSLKTIGHRCLQR